MQKYHQNNTFENLVNGFTNIAVCYSCEDAQKEILSYVKNL